jgi:putative hydrolase
MSDMEDLEKKYRMIWDFHTHTTFSHGFIRPHGKGSVEDNVKAAIAAGLDAVAISDHGPGHVFYGIRRENIPVEKAEIERIRKKYPEIKIYMSVEANITETVGFIDLSDEEKKQFDFINCGYHYGVRSCHSAMNKVGSILGMTRHEKNRMIDVNTRMYLDTLSNNDIFILTHPGDKGPVDMEAVAKKCAETNTLMEISTWHKHLTVDEIKTAMKEDVNFVISSDAHTPDRVGSYVGGLVRAAEAGLDFSRIVNIRERAD